MELNSRIKRKLDALEREVFHYHQVHMNEDSWERVLDESVFMNAQGEEEEDYEGFLGRIDNIPVVLAENLQNGEFFLVNLGSGKSQWRQPPRIFNSVEEYEAAEVVES